MRKAIKQVIRDFILSVNKALNCLNSRKSVSNQRNERRLRLRLYESIKLIQLLIIAKIAVIKKLIKPKIDKNEG
jgi:hypothetical protein